MNKLSAPHSSGVVCSREGFPVRPSDLFSGVHGFGALQSRPSVQGCSCGGHALARRDLGTIHCNCDSAGCAMKLTNANVSYFG